ncbi:MAG: hypothetical protein ACLRPD_11810 [Megamonas funiformis]|jgi:hypothetical protein|uniref:hypothetical protein n=1 Tax=Megamonas funiformis TaxID=437897 RepID=UPI0039907E22
MKTRYIVKSTNGFKKETNSLKEAKKILANESTKNFNDTFMVIKIDVLIEGKVIEPEQQKQIADFIWTSEEEK